MRHTHTTQDLKISRLDGGMVNQGQNRYLKYLDCSSWRALLGEGVLGGGEIKESCLEKVTFEVSLKE